MSGGDNMSQIGSPVPAYTSGITEMFPRPHRYRLLETSIENRQNIEILPVNINYDQTLEDNFIEFRIQKNDNIFLDLSNTVLSLKFRIHKIPQKDGETAAILDTDNIVIPNGALNTIFKSASVFINNVQIENNYLFNYTSYIKLLTRMDADKI